jgi:cytochrome c
MTFAGLSNPQDRADVIAFLNQHSDAPKPLPAAPAQAAAKPGEGPNNGPQKANAGQAAPTAPGAGNTAAK